MSKYQPLSDRLAAREGDEWPTSFSELEVVLGFPLPKAARAGRAWWANDPGRSHSRAWAVLGWEVGELDHAGERVVFRRSPVAAGATEAHPPALGDAAESASSPMHATRKLGAAAVLAAGVAVVAGMAALMMRGVGKAK